MEEELQQIPVDIDFNTLNHSNTRDFVDREYFHQFLLGLDFFVFWIFLFVLKQQWEGSNNQTLQETSMRFVSSHPTPGPTRLSESRRSLGWGISQLEDKSHKVEARSPIITRGQFAGQLEIFCPLVEYRVSCYNHPKTCNAFYASRI